MPTTYVPPYTVTVTSTLGGLAKCMYVDGTGKTVPPGTVLTTSTPTGQEGQLPFNFVEATVDNKKLRLVGAAVKTVDHDPTMNPYNYLPATRTETDGVWRDGVVIPWSAGAYNKRGVVLLFAQVNTQGEMVNFYPSADPQTQNDQT